MENQGNNNDIIERNMRNNEFLRVTISLLELQTDFIE